MSFVETTSCRPMRAVDRKMLVASILWAVVSGMSCSSNRAPTSPLPDDARPAATPADARPADARAADAMPEVVLSPSLPGTREETLSEINKLLAEHSRPGNPLGVAWRIESGRGDTLIFHGTPHPGFLTPRRLRLNVGAAGAEISILDHLGGRDFSVMLVCAADYSNPTGPSGSCFRDQLKKYDTSDVGALWLRVGPGIELARRLRRLLMHLFFTLDRRPVPPPRTNISLPATREETLDKANKMLERYHKASQPRDSRESDDWRFEIRPPGTLVVRWSASQMHDRGVFSIPIDRLARHTVVEPILYGKSKYPPHALVLSCRRSPVVDDKVQGCIGYRSYLTPRPRFPPSDPELAPRLGRSRQLNAISMLFPSDKKLVNDIRALLYHAMFTLKK